MSAQIEIFGMHFSVKGSSEKQINQIAELLNSKMHQIAKTDNRLDFAKIAVLAALNLAEDYLEIEKEYHKLLQLLEEEAKTFRVGE